MTHIDKDVKQVLLDAQELDGIVTRLAQDITRDYKDSPRKLLILSILCNK